MTTTHRGVVKSWHSPAKRVRNFAVVEEMIKLVLHDQRKETHTHGKINELFLGEHNPRFVQVPARVLHGPNCIGDEQAIVTHSPTELFRYHDPDEFRMEPDSTDVPDDWGIGWT